MEQYFRTRASVDDDPDLARNRRANDARLKSRFEHIFAKYGKDFDGVGDEIDLETGHIIVNNGHIERMQHEVDPGRGASSQVLRVLGGGLRRGTVNRAQDAELVVEDSTEEVDDAEDLGILPPYDYSSDISNYNEYEDRHETKAGAPDELSSDFFPTGETTPEKTQGLAPTSVVRDMNGKRRLDYDQAAAPSNATLRSQSPENQPVDFSFMRDSMEAMQVTPGQRGSVDPDAIQALGQSIANQLAKLMTGSSQKPKRRSPEYRTTKDSRWEYPILPGDRVDRTPSPPLPASASAALFAASPGRNASLWAPEQRRRRRQSRLQSRGAQAITIDNLGDDDEDPLQSDPPYTTSTYNNEAEEDIGIDCYNCGETNTRTWRTGPGGPLCDSCGTYYCRYGLLKTVEAPPSTPAYSTRLRHLRMPGRRISANQATDVFTIPSTDLPEAAPGSAAETTEGITKVPFSLEEEEDIIQLHEVDQLPWNQIGYLVSRRTANSVHRHYHKILKGPMCEARQRLLHQKSHMQPFENDLAPRQASTSSPAVAAADQYFRGSLTSSVVRRRAQLPRTPFVHVSPVAVPPRLPEVGASAWATTQPASKGPMPFQPARRGRVPSRAKSASRGPHDPFVSRALPAEPLMSDPHHGAKPKPKSPWPGQETSMTRLVPELFSRSAEKSTGSYTMPMESQHEAMPGIADEGTRQSHELPASVPYFTAQQDMFIKQTREDHKLSWAAIAEALPGDPQYSASAIMHRYYDFLIGRAFVTFESREEQARKAREKYGMQIQFDGYNDQSMSRTRNFENTLDRTTNQPQGSKPLLRQALKNSKRRSSGVASTVPRPQGFVHRSPNVVHSLTDDGYESATPAMAANIVGDLPTEDNALLAEVRNGSPSPAEQDLELELPDHSTTQSKAPEPDPLSHPEVVIRSGENNDLVDQTASWETMLPSDDAHLHDERINQQVRHQMDLLEQLDGDFTISDHKAPGAPQNSVDDFRVTTNSTSSATKRKRPSRRSKRVSDSGVANSTSDIPSHNDHSEQLDGAAPTTPVKRGRGRPRNPGLFANGKIFSASMPEPGSLPDVGTQESLQPQDRGHGCLVENSPNGEPPRKLRKIQEHVSAIETPDALGTTSKQALPSPSVTHAQTNQPDHDSGPPDMLFSNWEEILLAAFRSQPGKELRCRDISEWIRNNSSHYRDTKEPWIHHIYNEIYRNPAFKRVHPGKSRSGYTLVESEIPPDSSVQHADDEVGNEEQPGSNTRPTPLPERAGGAADHKDRIDTSTRPTSEDHADNDSGTEHQAELQVSQSPSGHANNDISMNLEVEDVVTTDDLSLHDPHVPQPADAPTESTEIVDVSSDPLVKQEPVSRHQSAAPHVRHSTGMYQTTPRTQQLHDSDAASKRRVSALATPARSGPRSAGNAARSTLESRVEPLFDARPKASPTTSDAASIRRVVVATGVGMDDGNEEDELYQ